MIKLSLLVAPCFLLATFQLSVTMIESFEDDASSISSYSSYGVDVSFPIHHESSTSINYDYLPHNALPSLYPTPQSYRDMPLQPLGDRQAVYQEFLQGCVDFYSNSNKCGDYERDRVTMNLRQPQSMINYTDMVSTYSIVCIGLVRCTKLWILSQLGLMSTFFFTTIRTLL